MPDREPEEGHSPQLLRALIWSGVGLAPVAAIVVLIGGGGGSIRFAVLLVAVCVVVFGASLLIRNDPVLMRMHVEERVGAETDAIREELRGEFAAAARVTHHRVQTLQDEIDRLRGVAAPAVAGARPEPGLTTGGRAVAVAADPGYSRGGGRASATPGRAPESSPGQITGDARSLRPRRPILRQARRRVGARSWPPRRLPSRVRRRVVGRSWSRPRRAGLSRASRTAEAARCGRWAALASLSRVVRVRPVGPLNQVFRVSPAGVGRTSRPAALGQGSRPEVVRSSGRRRRRFRRARAGRVSCPGSSGARVWHRRRPWLRSSGRRWVLTERAPDQPPEPEPAPARSEARLPVEAMVRARAPARNEA